MDWQASPIDTSISTHPISELGFPAVTVCPPDGSNTALNYDLIRSGNISLTKKERQSLLVMARSLLIDKPSSDFVKMARALSNEKNIPQVYDDNSPTQSYPIPYFKDNSFFYEIWSSKLNGTYKTPRFGQKSNCSESFPNIRFSLLKADPDSVLDIEVHWHENENWQVEYKKGPKYAFFNKNKKTWQEAENFCQQINGHLAKVENMKELWEIDAHHLKENTWLGGTDSEIEGEWVWSDGSPWPVGPNCNVIRRSTNDHFQTCTAWDQRSNQPSGGHQMNCLTVKRNVWTADKCSSNNAFICQLFPLPIAKNKTKRTISLDEKDFRQIEFRQQRKKPSCKSVQLQKL